MGEVVATSLMAILCLGYSYWMFRDPRFFKQEEMSGFGFLKRLGYSDETIERVVFFFGWAVFLFGILCALMALIIYSGLD